jgi:hypothetical protein
MVISAITVPLELEASIYQTFALKAMERYRMKQEVTDVRRLAGGELYPKNWTGILGGKLV